MINPIHVAIIGGGRWTRVLASVCIKLLPARSTLILCSPTNQKSWHEFMAQRAETPSVIRIEFSDQSAILDNPDISHVLIARRAAMHKHTASLALAKGKRVFVEKPFAVNLEDAAELVAQSQPLQCVTGLVFRYSSNLRIFSKACCAKGQIRQIDLYWSDPTAENRYGENKTFDPSLNIAWDVFPHVWSILAFFLPDHSISVQQVRFTDAKHKLVVCLKWSEVTVNLQMHRNANARVRKIEVYGDGWSGDIEFSKEPGNAKIGDTTLDVAHGFSSPLALELAAFFAADVAQIDSLCDIRNALPALQLADLITKDVMVREFTI